ncbi:flagellin N-terminal helical domain-containing protein [Microvirga rosea]|uniref:flagellin N-terminal helical domain-containing protein n=1 Tax=Microvirga rosea TaxID=2715425 RepID=UPI001D0B23BC|nr:flagellin [Microvirga rosea]MCB8823444.1 flagellin [Microvirga rosea]
MSSLLTNTSAMTALTTLKSIAGQLDQTSSRISTGLKVNDASDNAAYWSIATTIRADNGSLGAVKDALGLGAASVDTAFNGMNRSIELMKDIQAKLTAAMSPNVDRAKIQTEIDAKLKELKQTSDASVVSGENWLSTDSSAGNYVSDRKVVASFTRIDGNITVDTVTISVNDTKLYDKTTTAASGTATNADISAAKAAYTTAEADWDAAQSTWDRSAKDAAAKTALDTAQTTFNTAKQTYATAIDTANKTAQAKIDGEGGILNKEWGVLGKDEDGAYKAYEVSIDKIDISNIQNQDLSKLRAYVAAVDKALGAMTDAATTLGANKSQIASQTTFVESLIKANERSIGTLVDADMEEESTRLKALQVQQQLGVQALSIANGSTQSILSLFQG